MGRLLRARSSLRFGALLAGAVLLVGTVFEMDRRGAPHGRAVAQEAEVLVETSRNRDLLSGNTAPAVKRIFGAEQAEGPPDVKQAGDNGLAWASQTTDGQPEWLLCEFSKKLDIRAVLVHETFNPGALVRVTAFNAADEEVVAWQGEDPTPRGQPRGISVIPVKLNFATNKIRLALDSPAVPGWNEIDAVGVEDQRGTIHWTSKAHASSSFGGPNGLMSDTGNIKPSYSSAQATGEPDTPRPGDQSSAWASATTDGQPEWLVCEFKKPQRPDEILVYENNAPGAITKITVFDASDQEIVAWEGIDPTPRDQAWGISVFPVRIGFEFRKLKLYIDSPAVPGYNEVDAVGLRTAQNAVQWASAAQASSTFGAAVYSPFSGDSGMMMSSGMSATPSVSSLRKELDSLRTQLDDVKQLRKELDEIKKLLKDKSP